MFSSQVDTSVLSCIPCLIQMQGGEHAMPCSIIRHNMTSNDKITIFYKTTILRLVCFRNKLYLVRFRKRLVTSGFKQDVNKGLLGKDGSYDENNITTPQNCLMMMHTASCCCYIKPLCISAHKTWHQ